MCKNFEAIGFQALKLLIRECWYILYLSIHWISAVVLVLVLKDYVYSEYLCMKQLLYLSTHLRVLVLYLITSDFYLECVLVFVLD